MEEDEEMEEDRNDEGRFIHRTFDRCTSLIAAKSGSRTVTRKDHKIGDIYDTIDSISIDSSSTYRLTADEVQGSFSSVTQRRQ